MNTFNPESRPGFALKSRIPKNLLGPSIRISVIYGTTLLSSHSRRAGSQVDFTVAFHKRYPRRMQKCQDIAAGILTKNRSRRGGGECCQGISKYQWQLTYK